MARSAPHVGRSFDGPPKVSSGETCAGGMYVMAKGSSAMTEEGLIADP